MAIPRAEILRAIIHCVKTCWVLAWISVHLVRRKGRDTLGDISLQHKSLCTGWATSCCNRLRDTLQRQIASWNCARKNLSLQQNFVATTGCTNSIWFDFGRAVASSHHPPRAGFFYYSIFIGIPSGSLWEAESFFKKKKQVLTHGFLLFLRMHLLNCQMLSTNTVRLVMSGAPPDPDWCPLIEVRGVRWVQVCLRKCGKSVRLVQCCCFAYYW